MKLGALFWLLLLPEIDIAFLLVMIAAGATLLHSLLRYQPQEGAPVS